MFLFKSFFARKTWKGVYCPGSGLWTTCSTYTDGYTVIPNVVIYTCTAEKKIKASFPTVLLSSLYVNIT